MLQGRLPQHDSSLRGPPAQLPRRRDMRESVRSRVRPPRGTTASTARCCAACSSRCTTTRRTALRCCASVAAPCTDSERGTNYCHKHNMPHYRGLRDIALNAVKAEREQGGRDAAEPEERVLNGCSTPARCRAVGIMNTAQSVSQFRRAPPRSLHGPDHRGLKGRLRSPLALSVNTKAVFLTERCRSCVPFSVLTSEDRIELSRSRRFGLRDLPPVHRAISTARISIVHPGSTVHAPVVAPRSTLRLCPACLIYARERPARLYAAHQHQTREMTA